MTDYRPIWLTVLPRERRARHPYQLAAMAALIACGISQLIIGPVPNSTLRELPTGQDVLVSWSSIAVGSAGLLAAVIPERVITLRLPRRRIDLDATWMRLWVELGCHGAIITVWLSFFASIQLTRPITDGLSITTALLLALMPAGAVRCVQILWTLKRAILDKPDPSGIIGTPQELL